MFRIILLIFIFLYFNGNFFYGFALSYIPFKNAQSINIYNMYKVFEDPNFTTFMNNPTQTGSVYKINGIGTILAEKTSSTWVILKLPYKVNHRYGDQLEILIPIIDDTWNINQNDALFNNFKFLHKNNFIENGQSYLKFWINYDTIKTQSDLNNLSLKNYKTIWLNKLYIMRQSTLPNNTFLIR